MRGARGADPPSPLLLRHRGREGDGFSLADISDKKLKTAPAGKRPADQRPDDPQMGQALRSVYQKTVEEAVPDEMLDLLSRLG